MNAFAERLERFERRVAWVLWTAAAAGAAWTFYHLQGNPPLLGTSVFLPCMVWGLLAPAALHCQTWVLNAINRRNNQVRYSFVDSTGGALPKGRYIQLDTDLTKALDWSAVTRDIRWICGIRAAVVLALLPVMLVALAASDEPWILLTICSLVAGAAWGIYPRSGCRYRTGITDTVQLRRDICMSLFIRQRTGPAPIESWHPSYFKAVQTPSDGTETECAAMTWTHSYAVLCGDLNLAQQCIDRALALVPSDAPVSQYLTLGTGVYFYSVVAPQSSVCASLAERMGNIHSDLPVQAEYIEAALALAHGDAREAVAIADSGLHKMRNAPQSAATAFEREQLMRCKGRAEALINGAV